MTIVQAARRARAILADEGPRALLMRALAVLGYRRLLVFERAVDTPVEGGAAAEVVELGDATVDEYLAMRPDADPADVRWRLARGDLALMARVDGRAIHASWVTRETAWIDYLGLWFPLGRGEVLVYDTYTTPAVRGGDVSRQRMRETVRRLREAGDRTMVAVTLPENRAGVRLNLKSGYRATGRYVRSFGLGRFRVGIGARRRP